MRVIARICLLVGLCVSVYLATVSMTSGTVAGCGGDSPCDKVLTSRWAYLGPIPVSIPAILAYGLLLVFPASVRLKGQFARACLIGLAASVVMAILWFASVQVFLIERICPVCMTSHVFGSIGSLLVLRDLFISRSGEKPFISYISAVALGTALAAAFVALQVVLPQPERSIEFEVQAERKEAPPVAVDTPPAQPVPDMTDPVVTADAIAHDSPVATSVPEEPATDISVDEMAVDADAVPVYSIHGGAFTFPLNEVPGIGDWDSPNIMLNLIDFACDHCREHYRVLRKRAPWYEGEIFFGVMPLALNERCNPYFSMPGLPDYANCEYARLALAVWRMEPDKYLEFVDWLCDEDSPPASLEAEQWTIAREYAENLIGKDKLDAGWSDPWVEDMMHTLTELYGYNLKLTGEGAIPQQFLNQKLRFGEITTESSFNMIMGMNYPIEIKPRR